MKRRICIIIPCFNEEECISSIIGEIEKHILGTPYNFRFIFVDDGSTDRTYEKLIEASRDRNDVDVIRFSRNFGKEAAIVAGLRHCDGDAALIIDVDLQHPPDLIPAMISEWEKGNEVVDAVKYVRRDKNVFRKIAVLGFYRMMKFLTDLDQSGASDYKLLDRKAIQALHGIDEKNRFFRGLTDWIGFKHSRITFDVQPRLSGKSKWNWTGLARLSLEAITSYSSKPLQLVTLLGCLAMLGSAILGAQTMFNKITGRASTGFTTVILLLLILSSVIMISLGIIGLYIGKIYWEIKNRPLYVVEAVKTERMDPHID